MNKQANKNPKKTNYTKQKTNLNQPKIPNKTPKNSHNSSLAKPFQNCLYSFCCFNNSPFKKKIFCHPREIDSMDKHFIHRIVYYFKSQ